MPVLALLWLAPIALVMLAALDHAGHGAPWRAAFPTPQTTVLRQDIPAKGTLIPLPDRTTAIFLDSRQTRGLMPNERQTYKGKHLLWRDDIVDVKHEDINVTGRKITLYAISKPQISISLKRLKSALSDPNIQRSLTLSATLSLLSALCVTLLAALAGFALRQTPRGWILGAAAVMVAIPLPVLLVPVLKTHAALGLSGPPALLLAHIGFGTPVALIWGARAFAMVPQNALDAAMLEGANPRAQFFHVALPYARPMLLGLFALQALWVWNDYLIGAVFLGAGADVPTFLVLLQSQVHGMGGQWGDMAALVLISASPAFIVACIILIANKKAT